MSQDRKPPAQEMDGAAAPGGAGGVRAGAWEADAGLMSAMGLDDDLRDRFETSLDTDLSEVRVHPDDPSADAIGARAYATGADIHFAPGEYDPGSQTGQNLIAHEVAHTVQQQDGDAQPQKKSAVSEPGDAAEQEADRAADAMTAGERFTISERGEGIARKVKASGNELMGFHAAKNQAKKTMHVFDWYLVAQRLESWAIGGDDVPAALTTLMSLGERAHTYEAALTFASQLAFVPAHIREVDEEAVRIGTLYKEWTDAVAAKEWKIAVARLQMMTPDDMVRRLQPLTWEQKVFHLQPESQGDPRISQAIADSEVVRIAAEQKAVDDAKKRADTAMTLDAWIEFVRHLNAFTQVGIMDYIRIKMSLGERAHALEAAYALDPQAENVLLLLESLDPEAKRIAHVYKSWTDAVRDSNWADAARWLDQMGPPDMTRRLAPLTAEQKKHIQEAWPDNEKLKKAIGKSELDRAAQLVLAIARLDWTSVARLMAAMSRSDVDAQLKNISLPRIQAIRAVSEGLVIEACDAEIAARGGAPPASVVDVPIEPPLLALPDFSSDTRSTRDAAVVQPWGGSAEVEAYLRALTEQFAARKLPDGTPAQRTSDAEAALNSLLIQFDRAIIEYAADWQHGAARFATFARLFCSDVSEGLLFKLHPELGTRKMPLPAKGSPDDDVFEAMTIGGSSPVKPITNRFIQAMSQTPAVSFGNYPGHGSSGLEGRGYSVDLTCAAMADSGSGFWPRELALRVIHNIAAAASAVGGDWQVVYNDASVALAATRTYGARISYTAVSAGSSRNNWHGPLNLHFHVDIVPKAGAAVPSALGASPKHESGPGG